MGNGKKKKEEGKRERGERGDNGGGGMDLGAIEQLESEFPWERGEEHGRVKGHKWRMKEIQEKALFQGITQSETLN